MPIRRTPLFLISHTKKFVAALALILGLSAYAIAHEEKAGPNGGPLADLGEIHLELVMTSEQIDLFVTDAAGDPVDVSDGSAKLIILAGTKKHSTQLLPTRDSVLGATFSVPDAGPYTIVAVVKLAGKKPFQSRFKVNTL